MHLAKIANFQKLLRMKAVKVFAPYILIINKSDLDYDFSEAVLVQSLWYEAVKKVETLCLLMEC